MAEEPIPEVDYKLVPANGGDILSTSKGFNGEGTATYPNHDTFKGTFVEGVSNIYLIN